MSTMICLPRNELSEKVEAAQRAAGGVAVINSLLAASADGRVDQGELLRYLTNPCYRAALHDAVELLLEDVRGELEEAFLEMWGVVEEVRA